jgi:hypothetical protein
MIPGGKVLTKKDANAYQSFKVVNDAVLAGITRLLQDPRPTLEEKDLGSSKIAASLSLGLCCEYNSYQASSYYFTTWFSHPVYYGPYASFL